MQPFLSLEDLQKRVEQLVSSRRTSPISEPHRQSIINKFANRSLQELTEMAHQLGELQRL